MRNKLCIAAGDHQFEAHLAIARERDLGIEIQEFHLPEVVRGNWQARLDEYKTLLRDFRGDLSTHNAFSGFNHASSDPEIVELTKRKYEFIFMIAKELGCKIIVSHFMWHPFHTDVWLYQWQEAQVKFWDPYVNIAEKEDFLLVGENTAETRPEIIKPIIDEMGSERFKFIMDVGHANLSSEVPIEDWITTFGGDLAYMHVHNNYGNYDAHNSVLKGTVNFYYMFKVLDRVGTAQIITTELSGEALHESIAYLAEKIRASPVYKLGQ